MRIPRVFPVAGLAVLLSALAGGFLGAPAQATHDQVEQQYRIFTAALTAVDREYNKTVDQCNTTRRMVASEPDEIARLIPAPTPTPRSI